MQRNPDSTPVGAWTKLENVGDVKRMLRWTILQIKGHKLDPKTGGVLGNLANVMLRAMEEQGVTERLDRIEQAIERHLGTKVKQ